MVQRVTLLPLAVSMILVNVFSLIVSVYLDECWAPSLQPGKCRAQHKASSSVFHRNRAREISPRPPSRTICVIRLEPFFPTCYGTLILAGCMDMTASCALQPLNLNIHNIRVSVKHSNTTPLRHGEYMMDRTMVFQIDEKI